MSLAAAQPTQPRLVPASSRDEVNRALAELRSASSTWAEMPLADRIRLAVQCLEGVAQVAPEWVTAACDAKGIAHDSPLAGEEIASGPLATVR